MFGLDLTNTAKEFGKVKVFKSRLLFEDYEVIVFLSFFLCYFGKDSNPEPELELPLNFGSGSAKQV